MGGARSGFLGIFQNEDGKKGSAPPEVWEIYKNFGIGMG